MNSRLVRVLLPLLLGGMNLSAAPIELRSWLESPQSWVRDTDGSVVSLGSAGRFDDTHVFAPMVAHEDGVFRLWYCGSRGSVSDRVFRLGLVEGRDGRTFVAHPKNPVYEFGTGTNSVLTPALLRRGNGAVLREDGRLRMWFSTTSFRDRTRMHTLHEASSKDGLKWSAPSTALLEGAYAPTVLRIGDLYQMWFTDVSGSPWIIRHAWSRDGKKWHVTHEPSIVIDQEWEKQNLFYPTVRFIDGVYLMWYGSYWSERKSTTALGFAASIDGLKWHKHPLNPVFKPDPKRPWESHYTTSQSIVQVPEGGLRMWYASRKAPPFTNKYFAINTAIWPKLPDKSESSSTLVSRASDRTRFLQWRDQKRGELREMLGIPENRVPLDAEKRGELDWNGIVIEKWVFTSERGSRVPAVLYRPKKVSRKMPAIVFTYGHGGSKSQWQYNYGGQLYAKMGLACLALDPLGEEERHVKGRIGTRAHDPRSVSERADKAGRLIMGKLVFDTIRGIDFLLERDDIDADRIGVAGNSLGGAKASWMAALEPRIRMAIVSGWAYDDIGLRTKYCTKLPNQRMREQLMWGEFASLSAPECAVKIMNGDADWVIDRENNKSAWAGTDLAVSSAAKVYARLGVKNGIESWYESDGGHRPFFAYKEALEWIHRHLGTPTMTLAEIRALPTINSGEWCDKNGIKLERLYGTPLHQRGATLPDLGIQLTPKEKLSCLNLGELGADKFTVGGWLKTIERR